MASSLTPASLTVTISEDINLNGQPINSKNELTVANIAAVDKRILTVPTTSEVTIVDFATGVSAGTFISDNLKYVRVTNKDTVNYARIRVTKAGSSTFDQQLDAGKSFMFGNTKESVSATAVAFATYVQMDSINAQAYIAPIDIEIFVASV
jgi:hypothetical protein